MSTYNNQTGMLPPQFLLKQRYVVLGQAGRGGMGAVYQAIDTQRGQRRVAIKELSQAHLSGEALAAAAERFQQEARMLGALAHPNLPRIHDAFSEQERFYLVMDFIEGQTLQQLLRERNQPLAVLPVLSYAMQLCDVLAYLHQQKPAIIFRDIKPSNVMITPNQHVFLIDFGIARFFKEGQAQDTLLLGSPGYAPPEQHGLSQTSPQSDIYSLGAMLHYCLSGKDPYYAKERFSFAPLQTINSQIPIELDQLIQRMVAYDPYKRPVSAQEVQQILARIRQQATEHTTAITPMTHSSQEPTQYVQPLSATPAIVPTQQAMQPVQIPPTVAVKGPVTPATQTAFTRPASFSALSTKKHPLWTMPFTALFTLLLILSLVSSAFLLGIIVPLPYGYAFLLESGLALLFIIVAMIGVGIVRSVIARIGLGVAVLSALVAGTAALSLGSLDVQSIVTPLLSLGTLAQLLTYGVVISALMSLVWLLRPRSWFERMILLLVFAAAAVCSFVHSASTQQTVTSHIFLVVALVVLIQSTLYAIQLERTHIS